MFLGQYERSLDEKSRLAIPSELRTGLGNGAVLTRSFDNCLCIYPAARWEALARAVDDLPLSKDALYGVWPLMEQGLIAARLGDADRAIAIIRQLLAVPAYLSPGLLRVDPRWAPLHGDPRFRKLAEMDSSEVLRIPAPASR